MRIALISDSHGEISQALHARIEGCDSILHLGDLGPLRLLTELSGLAPVHAVMGNTDAPGQNGLPARRRLTLAGLATHLRHAPWSPLEVEASPGLYLHGHIHRPRLERHGESWICCPGALTRPRESEAAYGILELDEQRLCIAIHALDNGCLIMGEDWLRH